MTSSNPWAAIPNAVMRRKPHKGEDKAYQVGPWEWATGGQGQGDRVARPRTDRSHEERAYQGVGLGHGRTGVRGPGVPGKSFGVEAGEDGRMTGRAGWDRGPVLACAGISARQGGRMRGVPATRCGDAPARHEAREWDRAAVEE